MFRYYFKDVCFLFLGLLNAEFRSTRSQYFIVTPQNQTLNEGDSTMLQCQVGNLQGVVQWTRNGFAMGKLITICYSKTFIHKIIPKRKRWFYILVHSIVEI